jgi:DNA-binding NtrC family response regulator
MATTNDGNSILAIDDEYDIVNIIKLFLQNHGFKVSIFIDPYTALEHFVSNSQDYHIVISDIRMPSMNGYEFVKQVKGIKPQVKIILMTSFEVKDKDIVLKCLAKCEDRCLYPKAIFIKNIKKYSTETSI